MGEDRRRHVVGRGVPLDAVAALLAVRVADEVRDLVGAPVGGRRAAAEEGVVPERVADVAESEHERVVGNGVEQLAELVVDRLHVVAVGGAERLRVPVAELELHEPVAHRADAVVLDDAGPDVDRRGGDGVHGVERVHGHEEAVLVLHLAERGDPGPVGPLGRARGARDRLDLGADAVPGRLRRGGSAPGPARLGEARARDDRAVRHVDRLHPGRGHHLGHDGLPVPRGVVARHRGHALGPPPVAERIGAHAGDERAAHRKRRHALRNRAVEAQRVPGQVVQIRRVGALAVLERLHVVGSHQRQHHQQRAAALLPRARCPRGPREAGERGGRRGPGSPAPEKAAACDPHPPITVLAPDGANCGSVPPASSARILQNFATISGCSAATSRSSSGSLFLS